MTKFIFPLIVSISGLMSSAQLQGKELTFTVSASTLRPLAFSFQETSEMGKGLLIDSLADIFSRMGYTLKVDRIPFQRFISAIKKGDLEITSCDPSLKRDYVNLYHASPRLFTFSTGLWTEADNPATRAEDVKNETIMFSSEDVRIINTLKEQGNKIVTVPSNMDLMFRSFVKKKTKYYVGIEGSVRYLLQTAKYKDLKLKFLPMSIMRMHLCVSKKHPEAEKIVARFTEQASLYRRTPEFKKLKEKYKYDGFLKEF